MIIWCKYMSIIYIYILLIHAYVYIYIVIYYCSSYIKMLGSALWWLPSDISCLVEAVRESVDDMPSKVQRAAAATKKTEQKTRLHNGSEHVNVNFGIEVDWNSDLSWLFLWNLTGQKGSISLSSWAGDSDPTAVVWDSSSDKLPWHPMWQKMSFARPMESEMQLIVDTRIDHRRDWNCTVQTLGRPKPHHTTPRRTIPPLHCKPYHIIPYM